MPRYKLFLLERPTGDARTIQRVTWALPSALDVAKLTKALKGEIEVDWLEIAASDRKREILKIQHELGKHGCMLAIDDAGGTLTKDLTAAVRQALSREGRRASRERARQRTIWEGGEGLRAIPVSLARHARAIASVLAALAVVGGSVVLLAVWMSAAPRARGDGSGGASALERLSALSRGDANLPAIPDSPDGGGAADPGEPVSRGGARPLPAPEADGSRSAIPDVPSGGAASGRGGARAPRASDAATDDTRAIEIAGFAAGIGWAALVEAFARRGTGRSGSRSRALLTRLVAATVAGSLTATALIALEARTAPTARAAARRAPETEPAGPASRHESRGKPAFTASAAGAARAERHAAVSYRALMAALVPAPDPCAEAPGAFARFLCLERLRHPSAAASNDGVEAGEAAAGLADSTPAMAQRVGDAERSGGTPAGAATPAARPATAASAPVAAASPTERTPAAGSTSASSHPTAPANAASSVTGATPPPSATTSSAVAATRSGASPRVSPTATTPAPPPVAPKPAVASRRNLLAALPTFLLGLLAGTLGLAIVALGTSGKREAAT